LKIELIEQLCGKERDNNKESKKAGKRKYWIE
jgi:hypothetical protein